jgi:capsular exopolysaccharide synthesis family protein
VELKDYWHTIRRRWVLVLSCLAVFTAGAAFLTWTTTPQYASSAQLFVSTTPSDTADAYQGGLFATQRVTSYADLVATRQLAETVADNLGDDADAEELRQAVSAGVVPETVSLEITATDPDQFRARDIAQAYAEALSDLVAELETPRGQGNALITASIVDNAEVSSSPISPDPVRNLGLGLVLGLLLGVGLAVLRELLDTSVSSTEDIAGVTTAPVLGHINTDPAANGTAPAEQLRSATPWAEAFRVLRTNMQFVEVDAEQRVFVISSALPAEGKSTVAANLAVTLALAGQRVALVDADLRRPKLASRLGVDQSVGTTSVLIGRIGLVEALQSYSETGLDVLASGPRPPNPSELLQSHAMRDLIAELRLRYDVVLIDSPPLLPVTDAALLAAQADGLIVVMRHGKTTRDQLAHALDRVTQVGAKCVGIVVNLAPLSKRSRGYGYGYSYAPTSDESSHERRDGRSRPGGTDPGAEPPPITKTRRRSLK